MKTLFLAGMSFTDQRQGLCLCIVMLMLCCSGAIEALS